MIAGYLPAARDPRRDGEHHGRRFQEGVRNNVERFLTIVDAAGWRWVDLVAAARAEALRRGTDERQRLNAIADGAGVDRTTHLVFALTGHVVAPEECTVAAAVGRASATGSTVLLKNSDKIGADSLVGTGFHRLKEINVVIDLTSEEGVRTLGVAAAGSTNLKMGVNDAGVVAASNIARTTELRLRRPGVDDLRAFDRGLLLRRGLEWRTAWEATTLVMKELAHAPMATPGNIHFAGADRMFVVEGSYDRLAMELVQDRVVARSNMFVLLDQLNDSEDRSSPARYARALAMLAPHGGSVTTEHLREVSADHGNGPGLDSICRHSDDHRDETSLSAMIAAVDGSDPAGTRVDFALGKPCWAWSDPEGVLSVRMDDDPAVIAERFRSGASWRRLYREDARTG